MSQAPNQPVRQPADEGLVEMPPDQALLEQILQETLRTAELADSTESNELDVFMDLARRRRGLAFSVTPVATELVYLVLKTRFRTLSASPEFWNDAAERIARLLSEDPHYEALLRRFWATLCEKAA